MLRALLVAACLVGVAHAKPCAREDRPVSATGLQAGRLQLTDTAGFSNAWTHGEAFAATLSDVTCRPRGAESLVMVSVGLGDTVDSIDAVATSTISDYVHIKTMAGRFKSSGPVTARIVELGGSPVGEAVAPVIAADGRAMFVMALVETPRQLPDSVWPLGRHLVGQGEAREQADLMARYRRLYAGMKIR